MMKKKAFLVSIMALAMCLGSCKGNNAEKAQADDIAAVQEYVEEQFTDDTIPVPDDDSDCVMMLQPGQSIPQPGDKPVVVDLFATWCGPCQTYGPIFDQVAAQYASKAVFVRVDIDQNPDISADFEISAIPTTVILTRDNEPVKIVGLLSQSELQEAIEQALN